MDKTRTISILMRLTAYVISVYGNSRICSRTDSGICNWSMVVNLNYFVCVSLLYFLIDCDSMVRMECFIDGFNFGLSSMLYWLFI